MTEPSQYFKGRTVQEQMNEVIGYVDVRSAEVATNAIAADVAQVHQDMLDADADASAAAASAAAAAGTLANAVKKTGEASQSIAGNIEVSGTLKSTGTLYAVGDASVGGNLGIGGSTNVRDLTATGIVTVPTPTGNNYAANKKYVDDALDNYAPMVRTTGNQTIAGIKTVTGKINGLSNINNGRLYAYHGSGDYWRKKINILQDTSWCAMFMIKSAISRGINGPAIFVYQRRAGASDFLDWIYKPTGVTMQVGVNDDGIYVFQNGSDGLSIELLGQIASQVDASTIISIADDAIPTDPVFRVTI